MAPLQITLFTDPACPFAFSAEPSRLRLRWSYGDQLEWRTRMIVLTLEDGEAERLAQGAPNLQRRYGMPIDPAPYPRPASSEPACRAVVATRVREPGRADALLRALRVRVMSGGLLDDPALIAAAAGDAGLDPEQLTRWCAEQRVGDELRADVDAARSPARAARALDHRLGGPREARRYTAPSYELRRSPADEPVALPGFNPYEVYETAIANLAPELVRRDPPESVEQLLAWAAVPLATAEAVAITELDEQQARAELARVAGAIPAGADTYWERAG